MARVSIVKATALAKATATAADTVKAMATRAKATAAATTAMARRDKQGLQLKQLVLHMQVFIY